MAEVTVVNATSWSEKSDQLAQLLARSAGGGVIPDPGGTSPDPDRLAGITDPIFWSGEPSVLRDALRALALPDLGASSPSDHRSSGVIATGPDRLKLTVEEAAATLGTSRASAYEAVRRGEIPAIRIGRRVLVPRMALDRMLSMPETQPEG
ncbi:MAG TPA: helix-turn-helix domain-containing protein [Acidimicrobiales bacterium]|nr:helix-turn-helix domain-containing protein [Acidimicrobiales bacterium]